MTQEATQPGRVPVRSRVARAYVRLRDDESFRAAWRAFAWTRIAILVVAVYAALAAGGAVQRNAGGYDLPAITAPLGGFGDVLATPLARWDAVWYLSVAVDGYDGADSPRHAFFPLYPVVTRGVAMLGGGGAAAVLIASYLVALAAFLAALVLLHRLTAFELGRAAAWPTVLLISVFPASLYFGAPYSESLFLLCSVGAFYAARRGSWALAGAAAGLASATRSAGILLLVPLALLYWQQSHRRLGRDALWLALAPLGLVVYAAFLAVAYGDPLSFSRVQEFWSRDFAGPLVGAVEGAGAAFAGARQLLSGSRDTVYFAAAGGDPFRVAGQNVMLFACLCFAVAGAWGVLRRLPLAYGAYVIAALMLPLSFPVAAQPLMSLPRFVAVLFPIFMWLGAVTARRGSVDRVAVVFAVLLGLFVTQYATWQWVA